MCAASLHRPGWSTPPTQHAQQTDAVPFVAHGAQSKPCAEATCSAIVTTSTTMRLMAADETVLDDTVRACCVGCAALYGMRCDAFSGSDMLRGACVGVRT